MAHRLDLLLRPKTIAVVGASARAHSVGNQTLVNLKRGNFPGSLFAVNPKYDDILGVACYPSIRHVPKPADLVIFALSDERLEEALEETIQSGVKAVTIMSSLILAEDSDPPLKDRVKKRASEAGLLVCGGNGMGFYNFSDHVWGCGFSTRAHQLPGNVTFISQSGSGMGGIIDVEGRIDFNLAVSTGQELTVTMADYLDFALDQPETRVVGLFMETIRDVPAMIRALEKAKTKGIPIIAVKVGRTELAAKMAYSHTGALAGQDSAYQALFDRYGVSRVADCDELATAMIMFAQPHPVGNGGLVSLHDSGGVRQLTIDLAEGLGVELTELEPDTVTQLEQTLDPGLPAINPLDSWSTGGADFDVRAAGYLTTLMEDQGAALGAVIQDRIADSAICPEYIEYLHKAHAATGKPAFLVAGRQGTGSDPLAIDTTRKGFPVLDGVTPFLKGVRHLFDYRDFRLRNDMAPPTVPDEVVSKWRNKLVSNTCWDEALGAELLVDFNLQTLVYHQVDNEQQACDAADKLGYPVALKTAEDAIMHKTDVDGVKLHLDSADGVRAAYSDLANRLGPQAVVTKMIRERGIEMILGLVNDEQFGPLVMIGFGGVHAEILNDVVFLMPPFDTETAMRRLKELKLYKLFDGQRGQPPADKLAFAETAANFSLLAATLGDHVSEIDVNPLLVMQEGCLALDVLVVPKGAAQPKERSLK